MADILLNLIYSDAMGVADGQADIQQSLQALLKEHLQAVLEANPSSPVSEPLGLEMCRPLAWQVAGGPLRRDGNALASELLLAALWLSQSLAGDEAAHVTEFLERAVGVLMAGGNDRAERFRAYLEATLLDLARRRWFSFEPPPSPPISAISRSEPCVTLHTKDGVATPLLFHEILTAFWGTRLDTDCHDCQQPIVDEPPIRTISRVDPGPAASGIHVHVANRHFSCLRASGALWIPVSHVWHDSIRRANESRAHEDEAASTLVRTLTALLDASVDAFGPGVEFWHDYFSVPQWEEGIKEALLLQIPALYHGAQEILVQMSDLPGSYIMMALMFSSGEFSAPMALRLMPVVHGLCTSQWMERMWVLLEYALCRRACVMDKSDYIWRDPDESVGRRHDAFTNFVQNCHTILLGLIPHAGSFAKTHIQDTFLAGLTNKQDVEQRNLCLGEALELIARTKCQLVRDRFLAVHMLVNKNSPPSSPAIPLNATEACRWVWQAALLSGDFSPLLLQPHESHAESNPGVGLPSWMTGHSGLDHAEWALEKQESPPQFPIRLDKGVITTELNLVGTIEQIHYLDVEKSGDVSAVEWAVELLGSLTGTGRMSAAELVDGLNRIFPFDDSHTKYAQIKAGVVYTLDGLQTDDASFVAQADRCIVEFFAADPGSPQRRYVAQKITQLLKYDSNILGTLSGELTRLAKSRTIANSRRQRGAVTGDPICEVRCLESGCRAITVFRLDLRTNAEIGDTVYRVAGLSYSLTTENGVGLILDKDGRITGRMLYGPPGCRCQSRRRVEIH